MHVTKYCRITVNRVLSRLPLEVGQSRTHKVRYFGMQSRISEDLKLVTWSGI